jgi:O-antigen/teichoic acid export membrane protein
LTEPGRFRRQVLLNTASTGVANGWAMVVALVSLPLLLKGLGPTAFGTWVLVQTFSAVTGWFSLADAGVGTAATRAIAEKASLGDDGGVSALVSSALSVFAGVGTLCAGALALAGPALLPGLFHTPTALRDDLRLAIVVFAGQILLDLLTEGAEACLEGLQRVDLSRAIDVVRRTLVAVATVVVAQTSGRLGAVAVASLLASAGGTVMATVVLTRQLPAGLASPSQQEIRKLLSYAKVVAVLRPIGVLHRTMDRLVVGAVLGPAAVSLVEIATQVQNGADAVLSASAYAVVPASAWLSAREDHTTMRELLHRGTKYSMLVTVPVAAIAGVLAGPLVRVWLGDGYGDAAGLAMIAVLTVLVVAPLQVGSSLLLGVGRAAAIVRAAAAAVVVNLVASLILVHVSGIVGVFQATLIASAVLVPTLARSVLRAVGSSLSDFLHDAVLPTVRPTAALLAGAGAMVALDLSDRVTLVAGALIGLGAYAAVALRWAVDRTELAELRSLVSRRTSGE